MLETNIDAIIRPKCIADMYVWPAIANLTKMIKCDGLSHTLLFSGDKGMGKTTAARAIASYLITKDDKSVCDLSDNPAYQEIDAARFSKVDDMRELVNSITQPALYGDTRIVIIDEAHNLSDKAMDALLKTTEEPEGHLYIILCTTEHGKISNTLLDRCQVISFRSMDMEDMLSMVERYIMPRMMSSIKANGIKVESIPSKKQIQDITQEIHGIGTMSIRGVIKKLYEYIITGTFTITEDVEVESIKNLYTALLSPFAGSRKIIQKAINATNDYDSLRSAICNYTGAVAISTLISSDRVNIQKHVNIINALKEDLCKSCQKADIFSRIYRILMDNSQ